MTYIDGSNYKGEWRGDMRHGSGVMEFADGRIFLVEYAEDQQVMKEQVHLHR